MGVHERPGVQDASAVIDEACFMVLSNRDAIGFIKRATYLLGT